MTACWRSKIQSLRINKIKITSENKKAHEVGGYSSRKTRIKPKMRTIIQRVQMFNPHLKILKQNRFFSALLNVHGRSTVQHYHVERYIDDSTYLKLARSACPCQPLRYWYQIKYILSHIDLFIDSKHRNTFKSVGVIQVHYTRHFEV